MTDTDPCAFEYCECTVTELEDERDAAKQELAVAAWLLAEEKHWHDVLRRNWDNTVRQLMGVKADLEIARHDIKHLLDEVDVLTQELDDERLRADRLAAERDTAKVTTPYTHVTAVDGGAA